MSQPIIAESSNNGGSTEAAPAKQLRPLMTLMAATLQAAAEPCSCDTCRLLLSHAAELVPLLSAMADMGGPS